MSARVTCDCCELLSINGVICHETGCPNDGKRWEDGAWVRYVECRECGCDVREGESCDCQEPCEDEQPEPETVDGCFCGLRGLYVTMTPEQARDGSHQGACDADIARLLKVPEIARQLDAHGADAIRAALRECGAWDEEELADDDQNRARALWSACCDARESLEVTK